MNVGLYFGSFNPVHVGHLIITSYVANNTQLNQVWFVISPQNPFKQSSALLNEYHRLHLVNLAIEGNETQNQHRRVQTPENHPIRSTRLPTWLKNTHSTGFQ